MPPLDSRREWGLARRPPGSTSSCGGVVERAVQPPSLRSLPPHSRAPLRRRISPRATRAGNPGVILTPFASPFTSCRRHVDSTYRISFESIPSVCLYLSRLRPCHLSPRPLRKPPLSLPDCSSLLPTCPVLWPERGGCHRIGKAFPGR